MLRDDVVDSLQDPNSPLVHLAKDWRQLLFPNATDQQFADAYAQTLTFALLLARAEGAGTLDIDEAARKLASHHTLLSRALEVLTDRKAREEIRPSLRLLQRVIDRVQSRDMETDPSFYFHNEKDPWLYFYEDFLAAYDPKLRKNAGAYYTPVEVVEAQVRLIDHLLVEKLNQPLGFAEEDVVTLDPAMGTGTYLLSVIEHSLNRVEKEEGKGSIKGRANILASNLYGFEIMVGPYSVAEMRVSKALMEKGGELPGGELGLYLTDTLESPHAKPMKLAYYLKPISDQHEKALHVKENVSVLVCLGNPPYDRHEAASKDNKAQTGGWVRWADHESDKAILQDFIQPAIDARHGGHIKNLYNLYVYFWRWALWKVFEHTTSKGPGVVSFISASSYLDGDAFAGMRQHMRKVLDELWVIDLGGEGRGTRKTENVFAIQTPVAIAVGVCHEKSDFKTPAKVKYCRIEGTRDEKLRKLKKIKSFNDVEWQDCPNQWQAPFRPEGKGDFFSWPLLTDLMPWQHSGSQMKRTWPIAPDKKTLEQRWKALLSSKDRAEAFKETRDREISKSYPSLFNSTERESPISELPKNSPTPYITRYAYRSFDRQWVIADSRLGDYLKPALWNVQSDNQIYLASRLTQRLGKGPALTISVYIPDLHYFAQGGAKDIVPFYCHREGKRANFTPGLLDVLSNAYKYKVKPENLLCYIYALLAQPGFIETFYEELDSKELHIPLSKDAGLFKKAADAGHYLVWLHTYGERFHGKERPKGKVPKGKVRCTKAVPDSPDEYPEKYEYDPSTQTLHVGSGEFKPVEKEVFEFEVSGLRVVESWLGYRMKGGRGRKSSPLDDIRPERWTAEFTTELLELLRVLEATIALYPNHAQLLEEILKSPLFKADELPEVPESARKPPKETGKETMFD